ncbi:TPA: hypothetical protein ACRN55_000022 [Escherichia coli]|nr:hypothetical protein [Escherichia coli]
MGEISVKTGNNARNGGKNSLNRLIRCVCGKKIGPDPRNFNQRVSLGRNDLLIRTFPSYVYEIRVKSWWVNAGEAFMIYSLAENFCSSNGYTLPRANYLNHSSSRGIGSLYSEWGDMGHYTTDAGFQSNMYWSSSPANSSEQYVVSLATGDQSVFEKLGFAYATCYKNL